MSPSEIARRAQFGVRAKAVAMAKEKVLEAARLVADPHASVFSSDAGVLALRKALDVLDGCEALLADFTGGDRCR